MVQNESTMRTYFFVVPTIFRVGSVLRTDILKRLLEEKETRVVVVSPFSKDEWFKKEFPGVEVEPLDTLNLPLLRRIMRIRDIILAIDKPYFIRARVIERSITEHRHVNSLTPRETLVRIIGLLARPFRIIVRPLFDLFEEWILPTKNYEALIQKHRPDGFVLGTLSEPQDVVWLSLSRKHRIPAFAVDLPWSYMETRFFAVPRRAHIMVWNEKMKDEFASLYPFPSALLHTTGTQRYDFYVKNFPKMNRDEFLNSIGIDPSKRLITYFAASDFWHRHQADVCKMLMDAAARGALPKDTLVLVRLGWRQEVSEGYQKLKVAYPEVIIQKADESPNQDIPSHLIYYSDVSMSVSSSLTLDAAVLDRPKILTALTGLPASDPENQGLREMYKYKFLDDALQSGGIRVSYDEKDFIELVKSYMDDPKKDTEGRKKLVELYLGHVDGNAGKRIAEKILSVTKK